MALDLRRRLWRDHDRDLARAEALAGKKERAEELLLASPKVVANGNGNNVKASLELAESVAKAETDRESNLNTRGAAVATVAGIIVPIATVLAKPVFVASSDWFIIPQKAAEYFFLAALVSIASAMAMAVVGVLRPGRGGRTKNVVGEAVINVWRQEGGDIALATPTDIRIAAFRLDRLLRAIPAWHYRNRSKARWLRRSWLFLMFGIILLGSVGVIFLTEQSTEVNWIETVAVIAFALIVIWLLVRFDLVFAGRRAQVKNEKKQTREAKKEEEERDPTQEEAKKIVDLLGSSAMAATEAGIELTTRRRTLQDRRDAGWLSPEGNKVKRVPIRTGAAVLLGVIGGAILGWSYRRT